LRAARGSAIKTAIAASKPQFDQTLAALEREHGPLPPTWRFLTGGGGEHILFRHPGGLVPNSAGKIGPGIDVRRRRLHRGAAV
jgi:hypothetical protein